MYRAKDLRKQSNEELKEMCIQLSREIFDLVNELSITRKVEKPHLIRQKKKERARVLTVLQEKNVA